MLPDQLVNCLCSLLPPDMTLELRHTEPFLLLQDCSYFRHRREGDKEGGYCKNPMLAKGKHLPLGVFIQLFQQLDVAVLADFTALHVLLRGGRNGIT